MRFGPSARYRSTRYWPSASCRRHRGTPRAQTDGTDQIVKATDAPWTTSCQPTADGAESAQKVDKQLNAANPASLIAQVSVFNDGGKPMMRIIAPLLLSIANGLDLDVDGEDMGKQAFTTTGAGRRRCAVSAQQALRANARKGKDFKVLSRTISRPNISFWSRSFVTERRSCNRKKRFRVLTSGGC